MAGTQLRSGFTIIELMVALVLFAVGIGALITAQASSLRATAEARFLNSATAAAEAEIEFRRSTRLVSTATEPCIAQREGVTCTVAITPCSVVAGAVTCAAGVTSPELFFVQVSTSEDSGRSFELSAYSYDLFGASSGGGAATESGDGDGTTDGGAGDVVDDPVDVDPGEESSDCELAGQSGKCKKDKGN